MIGPAKITKRHLERLAVVYIRQSTLTQVRDNTESTARQYALAEEAARLGWESAKIAIIDADLGLSGRSASGRLGFKEVVSRVCLGSVGAIFGLEVSRLARSSADLQRLLEFCRITDTLIVDADGTYDLHHFNDRLLLGLKGTMSEAELHILSGRLQESKRSAARRGELRVALPVGYVYDDEGQPVMDPNEEIRAAVANVFVEFEATGSAFGVVGAFDDRRFPGYTCGKGSTRQIRWSRLSHCRVLSMLSNPAYAGAYVFGRSLSSRSVSPDGTIRTRTTRVSREHWPILIHDHHPAYMSWETFLANERRLAENCTQHGARPPREGEALLQGIAKCGSCGRTMATVYSHEKATYSCTHSRANHTATPACRTVMAQTIDAVVAKRILEVVSPDQITLALAASDEVTDRRARSNRALELQLERARYEATRAERAFHSCEPENRLVARSLEQRWEAKLSALAEAEGSLAAAQVEAPPLPPRAVLEGLVSDLPRLWAAPSTPHKDRKRLVRALLADVTVTSESVGDKIRVGIHWSAGAMEELVVRRLPQIHASCRTPDATIEFVRNRWNHGNDEICRELTAAGLLTGRRRPFTARKVRRLRSLHGIPKPPLLSPGETTVRKVASHLGVAPGLIYFWIRKGTLKVRRASGRRVCVRFSTEVERACRQCLDRLYHRRGEVKTMTTGGVL
jgi:DNA invertase Pin-like site-specific DNA recombinase